MARRLSGQEVKQLYRECLKLGRKADELMASSPLTNGYAAQRNQESLGAAIVARTRQRFREPQVDGSYEFAYAEVEALRRLCADVHLKKHPAPASAFERLKKPSMFTFIKKMFDIRI